ncbi:transposase [Mucilaginibacter flavus]|uniref:transposase n=1 Tax=Mucilaginibacter flavus TaxID=931504 RepID=UPI0025B4DCEB|nr:transposase [Mucilaginibacter flavus]MDN3583799.1 transposase [Mucilaginibacter flavus]
MIPKAKALRLIAIYLHICKLHNEQLQYLYQRYTNNDKPDFTDQEMMTLYLFVVQEEQRFKVSQIYAFADQYMRSWFPALPSYQAFNRRLNRLSEAFKVIAARSVSDFIPSDCRLGISLLDSMPIITCSGKRSGKVATEITDKGYCGTKSLYYYGLKLHTLAFSRPNRMPFPEQIVITTASESDLNVFKQDWGAITNRTFFGDKIYHNEAYFKSLKININATMLTPIKAIKEQAEVLKQRDKAANDLFNAAVSTVRQPIESLFNWLIEKTDLQRANKVRSTNGLLVHVFGKIAAAFIYLIF